MWKWTLVALLALCLAMTVVVACGDDDDDDDDAGGYSCADGCGAIYGCDLALVMEDGTPLSEAECTQGCEEEGGVDGCSADCLSSFEDDEDCEALAECAYECF
jgi:hypothetical protein